MLVLQHERLDGPGYLGEALGRRGAVLQVVRLDLGEALPDPSGYDALLPVWQGKKVPTIDPKGLANIMALSKDGKVSQANPADFIDNSLLEAAAK